MNNTIFISSIVYNISIIQSCSHKIIYQLCFVYRRYFFYGFKFNYDRIFHQKICSEIANDM